MAAAAAAASSTGAPATTPDPAAKAMLAAQAALLGKTGEDRVALIDQYATIIATATATAATKDMATRMLPAFFAGFDDETQTKAINAFLDLVEDEDASIHIKAIKNLPKFAVEVPSYVSRITDVLAQLIDGGDRDEIAAVTAGINELAGIDSAAVILRLLEVVKKGNGAGEDPAPLSPGSSGHDRVLLGVLDGRVQNQFRGARGVRGEVALATAKAMLTAAAECFAAGRERVARTLTRAVLQFSEFRAPRTSSSSSSSAAATSSATTTTAAAATDEPAAPAAAESTEAAPAGPAGLGDLLAEVSGVASLSASDAASVSLVLFFADVARRQRGPALEAAVLDLTAAGTFETLEEASQSRALTVVEGMTRGHDAARAKTLLPVVISVVRRVCNVTEGDGDAAEAAADAQASVSFGLVEKALLAFHRLAKLAPQEAGSESGLDFLAAKKRLIGFTGQPQDLAAEAAMDPAKRLAFTTALQRLRDQSKAASARLVPVQRALAKDSDLYKSWADAANALVRSRSRVDYAEAAAIVRKAHAAAVAAATEAAVEAEGEDATEEQQKAAATAAAAGVTLELPRAADIPTPEPLTTELQAARAKAKDIADKLTRTRTALDVCRSVSRLIDPLLKTDPATVGDFEPSYDRKPAAKPAAKSSSASSSSSTAKGKRSRSDSVSNRNGSAKAAAASGAKGKAKGKAGAAAAASSSSSSSSSSSGRRNGANTAKGGKGKGGNAPPAKRVAPARSSGGRRR